MAPMVRETACLWASKVTKWAQTAPFPSAKGDPDSLKGENLRKQILADSQGSEIGAAYLDRFAPGCFAPALTPGSVNDGGSSGPETNLARFLDDPEAVARIQHLAGLDSNGSATEHATAALNALRLTMRNPSVSILHPEGRHVALVLTSTTKRFTTYAHVLSQMTKNVDFVEEARLFVTLQVMSHDEDAAFSVIESLGPLLKSCSAFRHVTLLFVPARTCFDATLTAAKESTSALGLPPPELVYNKNFRINFHWLWATSYAMNLDSER